MWYFINGSWVVQRASLQLLFLSSVANTAPGCISSFFLQSPEAKNSMKSSIYNVAHIIWGILFGWLTFWVPFIEGPDKSVSFLASFLRGGYGINSGTSDEWIFSKLPSSISVTSWNKKISWLNSSSESITWGHAIFWHVSVDIRIFMSQIVPFALFQALLTEYLNIIFSPWGQMRSKYLIDISGFQSKISRIVNSNIIFSWWFVGSFVDTDHIDFGSITSVKE